MIVVVADDFSGAAEIGAVGMQHGLRTVVSTDVAFDSRAELVVIDTNSRSLPEPAARAKLAAVGEALRRQAPAWVFKKIDSVLRGHVVAELDTLLDGARWTRGLVVPANPALGRTTRQGVYYIDGVPLHRTSFAADEEYPASTSNVLGLLGRSAGAVRRAQGWVSAADGPRIEVGDAASPADLAAWCTCVSDDVLPAGGADFFDALLSARGHARRGATAPLEDISFYGSRSGLYVMGSRTPESRRSLLRLQSLGFVVADVADGNGTHAPTVDDLATGVREALGASARVIVAGDGTAPGTMHRLPPADLARIAMLVLAGNPVQEIIVEGGSTASLLVRAMGWQGFVPVAELGRGIVRMEVRGQDDVHLTVKPGSYAWPRST